MWPPVRLSVCVFTIYMSEGKYMSIGTEQGEQIYRHNRREVNHGENTNQASPYTHTHRY